jgi:hypothetical protein
MVRLQYSQEAQMPAALKAVAFSIEKLSPNIKPTLYT